MPAIEHGAAKFQISANIGLQILWRRRDSFNDDAVRYLRLQHGAADENEAETRDSFFHGLRAGVRETAVKRCSGCGTAAGARATERVAVPVQTSGPLPGQGQA